MFSCALVNAVFIPNCGFIYWSSALYRLSPAPVVILVSDLPPLSAPLLMCGIAKKALHLNLQGSFFDPISSSLSRLLFSCKPQKERMNKKDYNKKNVSRNMELLFQTKSAILWLLVIFGNYPSDVQTIPTPQDENWLTLFSIFFFSCSHSYGYCWRVAAVYQQIVDV